MSIRNLDRGVKERLRVRAAKNGRSMEAEIRAILADAVREPDAPSGLFHAMFDRFSEVGGIELSLPPRTTPVRTPALSG